MQLTLHAVAQAFNVSEKTVHKWIRDRGLPCHRDGELYWFNRDELLEWATLNRIPVPQLLLGPATGAAGLSLAVALERGGIIHGLESADKRAALRDMVRRMSLPPGLDRDYLLEALLAREALETTAVGDGIAVPHPRNPVVAHLTEPVVGLGFPSAPLEFGAADGKPVYALFLIVSPSVRLHLQLLARVAFVLRDAQLKRLLQDRAQADSILERVRQLESGPGATGEHDPGVSSEV